MKAIIISLALFVAVATAASVSSKCEEKCKNCKPLERSECLAGIEKEGECNCCDVCKKFEGQKCDQQNATYKHGQCGYGLECRTIRGVGAICQCIWEEIVCGSDGKTYTNLCHLMASTLSDTTLRVKSVGPCEPGAKIVTKPDYVRNTTNSDVVLTCEAIGFPTPTVYWEVTRANSKTFELPGDDNYLVTTLRGGPGKYQVTGWLQIEGLQKKHEGDYTCVAHNVHNTDRATARVKVIN